MVQTIVILFNYSAKKLYICVYIHYINIHTIYIIYMFHQTKSMQRLLATVSICIRAVSIFFIRGYNIYRYIIYKYQLANSDKSLKGNY